MLWVPNKIGYKFYNVLIFNFYHWLSDSVIMAVLESFCAIFRNNSLQLTALSETKKRIVTTIDLEEN